MFCRANGRFESPDALLCSVLDVELRRADVAGVGVREDAAASHSNDDQCALALYRLLPAENFDVSSCKGLASNLQTRHCAKCMNIRLVGCKHAWHA